LPEVAGDSAIQIGATDFTALAQGMNDLVVDKSLHEDVVTKGFVQAKKFTWPSAAQRLLDVYNHMS
jgi:hypothetical protein